MGSHRSFGKTLSVPGDLQGKRIVLGLSGGIACYKSAELVRLLTAQGAVVDVVMTASATQFITPVTMQALSGRPVYIDQWDNRISNNMAHIDLSRSADVILIAPTSANLIAQLAQGLAEDLLTTLCLARNCPLLLAPAMNKEMWEHPATQRNITQLRADGVYLLGPDQGVQACGEFGLGRMLEPYHLLQETIAFFQPKLLKDIRVLITAGPTFEAIDPVRAITNLSSGKTGFALAQAAHEAGAKVTLISGPVALDTPYKVRRVEVKSAQDMLDEVLGYVDHAQVFISTAAVADWHVSNCSTHKLKRDQQHPPELKFVANPDILATVAALERPPYCVGFAAETENIEQAGREKRQRKGIPLLVANQVDTSLGTDDTTFILFDEHGVAAFDRMPKLQAARRLIAEIAQRIN